MMWSPPPEPEAAPSESPDAYQLAMEAARSGQTDEAIRLMLAEIGHEHSGRGRFVRRSQLVQICIATGNHAVALPILQDLAEEINRRHLEEWEVPEMLSQPLGMLYGCLQSVDGADPRKQELYDRICRLDPLRAVNLPR
jgi:type VI secretion system protein ImpA